MDIEALAQAIRSRDMAAIESFLFERRPDAQRRVGTQTSVHAPIVRPGARRETELWDFKAGVPTTACAWAVTARHVLAFHNRRGGVLIYGFRDTDFEYVGATSRVDSKIFNDKIRKYLPDTIWVEFARAINTDQDRYVGLALIPPRGPKLAFFTADALLCEQKRDFLKGESALRQGDSSVVLSQADALLHQASFSPALISSVYSVDEPFFRLFALETDHYIDRRELRGQIDAALADPRTSVTSLVGIGGSGKTTLATAATMAAHDAEAFTFIVSLTAKDRELGTEGIRGLAPTLTSYEALLDEILEVLGLTEYRFTPLEQQQRAVREILTDGGGLLFVDNLETVDDPRIIEFLDNLPIGVKAIVTSRRLRVRVAVRPVDVGPLSMVEACNLVRSLADVAGLGYVADFTSAEIEQIATSCDRLPLAMRWTLLRAHSAAEALQRADRLRSAARQESELLEFAFRRVFDDMSVAERVVMRTLGVLDDPTSIEGVLAGAGIEGHAVVDALDELVADGLVQRTFDSERNAYAYGVVALTKSFMITELRQAKAESEAIRTRLVGWYEARDVANPDDRVIVRELRQGKGAPEAGLLDIASQAMRRGDARTAQEMYEEALSRNPTSWRAAQLFAEFERHTNANRAKALQLYEQAAHHAPSRGPDRAKIYREWGMLLKDSGRAGATDLAIEKFEVAMLETPNDAVLRHVLASMYDRKGVYGKVMELLGPLRHHPSSKTKKMALELLVKAYERTLDVVAVAECRAALRDLDADA